MTILDRTATARRSILLGAVMSFGLLSPAHAEPTKLEETPCFWQRDPEADFDNEGRNHCAPVAISGGLIYLAAAQGYDDLVDGTDHDAQIALITDLAEEMETDPAEGTNPDKDPERPPQLRRKARLLFRASGVSQLARRKRRQQALHNQLKTAPELDHDRR